MMCHYATHYADHGEFEWLYLLVSKGVAFCLDIKPSFVDVTFVSK